MFKCDMCNKIIGPNISSHKITVQKWDREYSINGKTKTYHGWEIVKELSVCQACKESKRN